MNHDNLHTSLSAKTKIIEASNLISRKHQTPQNHPLLESHPLNRFPPGRPNNLPESASAIGRHPDSRCLGSSSSSIVFIPLAAMSRLIIRGREIFRVETSVDKGRPRREDQGRNSRGGRRT